MKRLLFLTVFFALLGNLFSCLAQAADRQAMLGGAPVKAPQWLVYLQIENQYGEVSACSGSLVAPATVMTAGHCLMDISWGRVSALIDGRWYQTRSAAYHEFFYRPHMDGVVKAARWDVGYVLLSEAVVDATPLAVAAEFAPSFGEAVTVFGYGANERPWPRRRPAVRMGVFPFTRHINDGVWESASTTGVSVCGGDSGGPAVKYVDGVPVQVGINAYALFDVDERGVCHVIASRAVSGFVNASSAFTRQMISPWGARFDSAVPGQLASRIDGFVPDRPSVFRRRGVIFPSYPGASYEPVFVAGRRGRARLRRATAAPRVAVPRRVTEVRYRIVVDGVASEWSALVRVGR